MKKLNAFWKWFDGKGRKYSVYALGMISASIAFAISDKFTGDNYVTLIIALSGIFCGANAIASFAGGGK